MIFQIHRPSENRLEE